jgi:SAM-dependent methyltransferase
VIEHGVDVDKFLAEMARILAPGGLLFVSFDYWAEPVETHGQVAFGVPIFIFDRVHVETLIQAASRLGLAVAGHADLSCQEKVVHWTGMDFTFGNLLFERIMQ